ncbi:type VI secretion system-associated protein TagO [Stappia sp. ICDLI1TA098]
MQGILVRTAFAATASLAITSVKADPSTCASIENDLDRLACYDREVGRTPTPITSQSDGKWIVTTEKNKLTDQTDVFLTVESDEAVNCSWSRGEKIHLVMRCRENTTAIIINTGCHMTSSNYSNYGDVTYRIDQEPARTIGMRESTNNRSLGLWNGRQAIPVIKQMIGKNQVIMKMTPYGNNPIIATFQISGLETAIEPLRKECSW